MQQELLTVFADRLLMWSTVLICVYCLLVALASLGGGWLPEFMRLTHTRMQLMMSLVGGLMLGVAMLHLLPHAVLVSGSLDDAVLSALAGLLVMFLLIRTFHVHQHGPSGDEPVPHDCPHTADLVATPHGAEAEDEASGQGNRLSWIGLAIGLSVHTLIDGVALAASVSAESGHTMTAVPLLGLGTFVAVLLHKPLDALSITSVMTAGGWGNRWKHTVNACFALMCPLGALAFYFGVQELAASQHVVVGSALGFAGGVFLCISLADLLPEVQFHSHDRIKLSATLLLGVALAYVIGFFEPDHAHFSKDQSPATSQDPHRHDDSHEHPTR